MLQESDIIPYHLSPPPGERVLVLAPHPDDETLGCGGTIQLLLRAKKEVKVMFLTSGDRGDPADPQSQVRQASCENTVTPPLPPLRLRGARGALSPQAGEECSGKEAHITAYSLMREREAEKALRVLGVSDYQFLRFPDRGIHAEHLHVLGRLLKTVEEFMPDTIYSPSMVELHPDHRATAALSIEAQKAQMEGSGNARTVRVVFYEVTTPLRPNVLVDVTSVYRKKKSAAKRYRSQLKLMDYLGHITALNTVRRLTVDGPRYVEAFWLADRPLTNEDIIHWLSCAGPL